MLVLLLHLHFHLTVAHDHQRIEQLFGVMNRIFDTDPHCRQKDGSRLHNRTYRLVPMTTKVGMVEWVDNTAPLKMVLVKQDKTDAENRAQTFRDNALKLKKADSYITCYDKINRANAESVFETATRLVPDNLLRNHLLSLAPTAEAFLCLRSEFARSVSTFCVSSYVLGIGDRSDA